MGFWLAMTGCNLLIPLIMLLVGLLGMSDPPDRINPMYGYRTNSSMKNQETWDFAQAHNARLWRTIGLIMLPLSVLIMIPTLGKTERVIGIVTAISVAVQCAALILSVLPTELALRKNFDKDGNRKG